MNALDEIKDKRSLKELIPPVPDNYEELSAEEKDFYNYIRFTVNGLESARNYIQVMRCDYKRATRAKQDAYDYASDNAKSHAENEDAEEARKRMSLFLKETKHNLRYVTDNLRECLSDLRPFFYINEKHEEF